MIPGGMSLYPGCLQQHRKCQYAGNMINAANEESFPKKRCDYARYNLLPSNKSGGELTFGGPAKTRLEAEIGMMSSLKQHGSCNRTFPCAPVNPPDHPLLLSFFRYSQPFAWPFFWVHLSAGVDPLRLWGQCATAGQPAPPPGLWPAESPRPGHLNSHIQIPEWTRTSSLFGDLTFSSLSLWAFQESSLSALASHSVQT